MDLYIITNVRLSICSTVFPRKELVEKISENKKCPSCRDKTQKIVYFAATCMGSSPSRLISVLLASIEKNLDLDNSETIRKLPHVYRNHGNETTMGSQKQ
jgi:hypothetical protein